MFKSFKLTLNGTKRHTKNIFVKKSTKKIDNKTKKVYIIVFSHDINKFPTLKKYKKDSFLARYITIMKKIESEATKWNNF